MIPKNRSRFKQSSQKNFTLQQLMLFMTTLGLLSGSQDKDPHASLADLLESQTTALPEILRSIAGQTASKRKAFANELVSYLMLYKDRYLAEHEKDWEKLDIEERGVKLEAVIKRINGVVNQHKTVLQHELKKIAHEIETYEAQKQLFKEVGEKLDVIVASVDQAKVSMQSFEIPETPKGLLEGIGEIKKLEAAVVENRKNFGKIRGVVANLLQSQREEDGITREQLDVKRNVVVGNIERVEQSIVILLKRLTNNFQREVDSLINQVIPGRVANIRKCLNAGNSLEAESLLQILRGHIKQVGDLISERESLLLQDKSIPQLSRWLNEQSAKLDQMQKVLEKEQNELEKIRVEEQKKQEKEKEIQARQDAIHLGFNSVMELLKSGNEKLQEGLLQDVSEEEILKQVVDLQFCIARIDQLELEQVNLCKEYHLPSEHIIVAKEKFLSGKLYINEWGTGILALKKNQVEKAVTTLRKDFEQLTVSLVAYRESFKYKWHNFVHHVAALFRLKHESGEERFLSSQASIDKALNKVSSVEAQANSEFGENFSAEKVGAMTNLQPKELEVLTQDEQEEVKQKTGIKLK